jgi:hypothetical protein
VKETGGGRKRTANGRERGERERRERDFSSAAASLNPNLVWSQKFDLIDAKRFLLRDSCRSVARSLSSNHSSRAPSLYASTEVGT